MSTKSKNDRAWEKILEEVVSIESINEKGHYDITSDEIKNIGEREPRLACKIDYRQNMPEPLRKRKLSVLAIKNKRYRLARTDPFINVNQKQCRGSRLPDRFAIPAHIQVLTPQSITSESKALDAAFVSGMLNDVAGDGLAPVLRGREYCRQIDFSLPDRGGKRSVRYRAEGVQVEVDGGYEGQTGIHLFEAKLGLSDNMNLRQLLYPQLHYEKLFKRKNVNTHVMFYEQGKGYFHFFKFERDKGYRFSGYRRCALEELSSANFRWDDLRKIQVSLEKTGHGAPFPQADKFDKILALFLKLSVSGSLTKEKLFSTYDIVPRQYDYYLNALRWMGLAEETPGQKETEYQLTLEGVWIAKKQSEKEVLWEMAKIIFSNDLCNRFVSCEDPSIPVSIRQRNGLTSDSTFNRRMQTIKSWKRYFQSVFPA